MLCGNQWYKIKIGNGEGGYWAVEKVDFCRYNVI